MCCECDHEGGVIVQRVVWGGEAGDGEPGGERGDGMNAPVGVFGGEGRDREDGAEVVPGGYLVGGFLSKSQSKECNGNNEITRLRRKNWHIGMHLTQRLLMTMIRKLMAHRHGINHRRQLLPPLALLRRPPLLSPPPHWPARQALNPQDQLLDLSHALHPALHGVPLLTEPTRDIRLAAHKPRVDQDVVVDAAAVLDGAGRPRDLQQPRGIGVEVVK